MVIREILPKEKNQYNQLVEQPLQTWEWGEFRKKTGVEVIRLGEFEKKKLKKAYQLTVHPIPHFNASILYFPRGPEPDEKMLDALKKLGADKKAILVKMAPDVSFPVNKGADLVKKEDQLHRFLIKNDCRKTKPFFFDYTYRLDLTKPEDELLANMHSKTRYNIRLAQRHGVKVVEDNSKKAFKTYLKLMMITAKRQHYYAHTPDYHRTMWEVLKQNPSGQEQDLSLHLHLAKHQNKVLTAWMFFVFKNTLYYPYGGSSPEHRHLMPAYGMLWEAIKFGKKKNCQTFDLWGCLGPDPDPKDPWFGFHRFKSGFGGQLTKFIGTYDLVIDHRLYSLYNLADQVRWQFLKSKARFLNQL